MTDNTLETMIVDTKLHVRAFDIIHNPSGDIRRVDAVAAALELIKATCVGKGTGTLHTAMNRLSETADKIEEAVNKE